MVFVDIHNEEFPLSGVCVCGYENTLLLLLLLRRPDRPLAVCSGGGGGEGKLTSCPSVIVSVGGGNLCFDTAVLAQCLSFCSEKDGQTMYLATQKKKKKN